MKKLVLLLSIVIISLTSCSDARVASHNISEAAEQFEVYRRVVFYNGITDQYMLVVKGYCSIAVIGEQLSVTVKTANGEYLKHYLHLSDNITYFSQQLEPSDVSVGRYRVIFKPSVIVPNVDLE